MARNSTTTKQPKIVRMRISEITPADYNPRKISDEALAGLDASISRFGLVQPLVFNTRTKRLVGGHQRLKALTNRGVQEADVVLVDLDPVEEKALNVALNNPHTSGEYTDELQALLSEISEADDGFMEELRLLELVEDDGTTEDVQVAEIEVSPVRDVFWISVRGPLAQQAEALRVVREQLSAIDGVEVEVGAIKR